MIDSLADWLARHPDVLVAAAAVVVVGAVHQYGRAVQLRTLIRSGAARATSDALGG